MNTVDERITELETKIAFLELANQQMSDLIYDQQQQLDKHIQYTAQQFEGLQQGQGPVDPADEVPPHY